MNIVITILGIAVLLLIIVPLCSYFWGTMFAKGFISSMAKYFKHKTDKNEQEEKK
jgi:hypothetical protein